MMLMWVSVLSHSENLLLSGRLSIGSCLSVDESMLVSIRQCSAYAVLGDAVAYIRCIGAVSMLLATAKSSSM